MKILITGAKGFMGRNLTETLKAAGYTDLLLYDLDTDPALLPAWCGEAEFVFHLAGVNRPKEQAEFMEGNFGFSDTLLENLKQQKNRCPVMLSSSTQAALDNPYGASKKAGEDLFFQYARDTGAKVYVFRFPNVFGKWSRPNYNSAVATFCYNLARDLPITVNNRETELRLVYIDDVVEALTGLLTGKVLWDGAFATVPVSHTAKLGWIADTIASFRESRRDLSVPDQGNPLTRKLYATYLSFLPETEFSYPLAMHKDARGSFTEFLRTPERGQVSVNISKPGIVKGNHWHHTKNEKFLVVSGKGVIRFRSPMGDRVLEYPVNGETLTVVDIPTGYTHNIENTGDTDLVTIMWASECFDPEKPDTMPLQV